MLDPKQLITEINKKYGKDTVLKGVIDDKVDSIPTGCIALDACIGVGGIPTTRITEYYGGESSGKTTMALQTVSYCQMMGKNVVYIDAEHALDLKYASNLGVDINNLVIIQPDDAEKALNIIHGVLTDYQDSIGLVVLDSVAAMVPKIEADSESGDASVGLHARLLTSFVRKITPILSKTNAALLLINQQRANIGGSVGFGPPGKTTPGGYALKHGASVRVEFARTGNVVYKENAIGIKVTAQTRKNKVAPPYQKANFEIMFNRGVDIISQICDYAIELGYVKKSGSWYKVGEDTAGQGKEQLGEYLLSKNLAEEYLTKICQDLSIPQQTLNLYLTRMKSLHE